MACGSRTALSLAAALILVGGTATAATRDNHGSHNGQPAVHQTETYSGPHSYQRVVQPKGWNVRPSTVNCGTYQHNYQATQKFKVGPYHPPAGWTARRWVYGESPPPRLLGSPVLSSRLLALRPRSATDRLRMGTRWRRRHPGEYGHRRDSAGGVRRVRLNSDERRYESPGRCPGAFVSLRASYGLAADLTCWIATRHFRFFPRVRLLSRSAVD